MKITLSGLMAALCLVAFAPAAAADDGPPLPAPAEKLSASLNCPTTFAHPEHEPVLLVHGVSMTPERNWGTNYLRALPQAGFDTCTVALPDHGLGDIQEASEYVVHAVRQIHAATGRRVDMIGLSEGPLSARWAIKWWPDVRDKVDDLVSLDGNNHGTIWTDIACLTPLCKPYAWQSKPRSMFITALNAGDETPGNVDQTSIYSLTDPLHQPATTFRLEGATNIVMQRLCPGRYLDAGSILYDAVAWALTIDALAKPGGANVSAASRSQCGKLLPGGRWSDVPKFWIQALAKAAKEFTDVPVAKREPALKPYVVQ